ncbi:hypothetical protein D3C84_862240 [compost metagenome]
MRGITRAPETTVAPGSRSNSSTSDRQATSAPRTFATPNKARERWWGKEWIGCNGATSTRLRVARPSHSSPRRNISSERVTTSVSTGARDTSR